jgi:hypothetical protein
MALPDLTGKNIQETYQRLIQYDADTGDFYNGTGSLVNGLIQSIADASSGRQSDGNTLNSVSSSVVTLLEFSSSLDATFATDAELTSLSSSFVVTTDSLQTQVSRNVTDIAALDTSVDVLTSATSSYITDPFPYTGSATITGSLTVSGSIVDFTSASEVNINLEDLPLINPIVEYLDVTASITSGTSITLPNNLSYVSSSVYEYLEIFMNGLRLRYNRDFVPISNTTIQNQMHFPSGSELTFKSLKR